MPKVGSATDPKAAYLARRDQFSSANHTALPLEVARGLIWGEINKLPEKPAKDSKEVTYRFNLEQIAARLEHGFEAGEVIRCTDRITSDDTLAEMVGASAVDSVREAILILKADDN